MVEGGSRLAHIGSRGLDMHDAQRSRFQKQALFVFETSSRAERERERERDERLRQKMGKNEGEATMSDWKEKNDRDLQSKCVTFLFYPSTPHSTMCIAFSLESSIQPPLALFRVLLASLSPLTTYRLLLSAIVVANSEVMASPSRSGGNS